ncbi:MAG: hypothetical protein M1819_002462 [Sarea resinae]|nr:MAG: hypothetical protein M1819_002462 [Sarea resinae]
MARRFEAIRDVGDIPYELIRPVLLKLESPDQLRIIEQASSQICGEDAEIWMKFIKRDVPSWQSKPHQPRNPKKWYQVYRKLVKESEEQLNKDAEILKAALDGIKSEKAKHTSRMVDPISDANLPRLPRSRGMRAPPSRHQTTPSSSSLSFGSGSRTKTTTGKSVIAKAKREAKEMSLFSMSKSILATPTHRLNDRASQVRSAPRGLLDEHKRPQNPQYMDAPSPVPQRIMAPRRNNPPPTTASAAGDGTPSMAEREARLRALTNPSTTTAAKHGNSPPASASASASPSSRSTARGPQTRKAQDTSCFSPSPSPPTSRIAREYEPNNRSPAPNYRAPLIKPPSSSHSSSKPLTSGPPRPSQGLGPMPRKRPAVDVFMPVKKRRV